jgi:hypothetical protein
MKALVKVLNWVEWISVGIGSLFLLLALIQSILAKRFFATAEIVNYFQAANSFFLLAVILFLFIHFGQFKKK